MKTRLSLLILVAVGSLLFALPVSADTLLYDNGPITGMNNYMNVWGIWGPNSVTDSFTLATASTLTTAQVGLWTYSNTGVPVGLDWAITTSPFGGTTVASGAATPANAFWGYAGGNSVFESSFSLGGASLPAGTYWLQLSAGTSSDGSGVGWDINNGPSQAWIDYSGAIYPGSAGPCGGCISGSDSFQIYGPAPSTVPEPGTLALTASALLGAVGFLRRKLSR